MVLRLMTRTSEDAERKNENDGSAAYAPWEFVASESTVILLELAVAKESGKTLWTCASAMLSF